MKYLWFLLGLLAGGVFMLASMKYFHTGSSKMTPHQTQAKWPWPDSMDAVKAAPASHKVLYEDSDVRILYVTVNPGALEPVHTHQWRSYAWTVKNPPFTLYHYGLRDNRLSRLDSFTARLPVNKVNPWAPETPHAIRNASADTLVLYRVELKH